MPTHKKPNVQKVKDHAYAGTYREMTFGYFMEKNGKWKIIVTVPGLNRNKKLSKNKIIRGGFANQDLALSACQKAIDLSVDMVEKNGWVYGK